MTDPRPDRRRHAIGRPARLVAAAVCLVLATSTLAAADDLVADGDGLTPVAAKSLDFGTVCVGSTTTKPVALAISKKGGAGNGNRYPDGASVAVTTASVVAPLAASATVGTIRIPTNWSSAADGTMTPAVTSSVTLTAGAAGTVSSTIRYQADTVGDGPTKSVDLPVTASVVSCDTTPPTLLLPADRVVEATGPAGASVSWTATATDTAPASPAVTCLPTSGSTFALGQSTVTCRATDAAGNTATGSFRVSVVDTTAPVLSGAPVVGTVEATGPAGAVVTFASPTASDLVDGTRPVTCVPPSGTTFSLGDTTVTCTATDTRGNEGSVAAVVRVTDTTAPVQVLPAEVVAEATGPDGADVDWTASAGDTVDGAVTPSCDPVAGSRFALGSTTVTCTSTDASGNATEGSFPVHVVDTTAPTLELPADRSVEGDTLGGADVTLPGATATDLVDGEVDVDCDVADGFLALGEHVVTCSAVDAAGNVASGSWTVTVVDTTAPALTLPADQRVEAQGADGASVQLGVASAVDIVDGDLAVECDRADGVFALGVTKVLCQATDGSGNTATGSVRIEVVDTTGPSIDAPDRVVEATGPDGAPVTWSVSAADLVDGTVAVTCDATSGATFPLGSSTVSCDAVDATGNTTTTSFAVVVRDTTAPVLQVPALLTSAPTGPRGATVAVGGTAHDLVSGDLPVTCTGPADGVFGFGDTAVTCSAVDAAGNRATATVVVRVTGFTRAGFHQPVDMGTANAPVVNTVKGGSTVPLKFELFGRDGVEMTSTEVVTGTSAVRTSCTTGMTEDAIEATATGGTGLRWDATGGQFIHNWQTPKQAGTCWTVTVSFTDGTSLSARFKLK